MYYGDMTYSNTKRKTSTYETSRGTVKLGSRQHRILGAFAWSDNGVIPATTWTAWEGMGNKPKGLALADVLLALKEKGLIEPTAEGLFDLFNARLLPDYRITALGREVLA